MEQTKTDQEMLDGAVQITAADTTHQHRLVDELQSKHHELEEMNARIRSYGSKVDDGTVPSGPLTEGGELSSARRKNESAGRQMRIETKSQFVLIIIITSQPEYICIAHACKMGVENFWYKEPPAEALLKIMARNMAGESIYPASALVTRLGAALNDDFTK